jgi:23S rRNA (guanosine2251-2'-O)-methyltransferase
LSGNKDKYRLTLENISSTLKNISPLRVTKTSLKPILNNNLHNNNKQSMDYKNFKPQRSDEQQETQHDIIYGRHPVLDALAVGKQFEKVLMLLGTRGDFEKQVRQLCKTANIPLQVVPKEKLYALTSNNHQGIIGFVSPIIYQNLEDILPVVLANKETPLFVMLDGVTDVRNVGAIARSAELAGAHALIISKKNIAAINADAIKTSAGALNILPVCRVASLHTAVEYFKEHKIQLLAAETKATVYLQSMNLTLPTVIVMGAEGRGVNYDLLKELNGTFRIPTLGKTDSYNVSVAAGMVLYETMRQRLKLF